MPRAIPAIALLGGLALVAGPASAQTAPSPPAEGVYGYDTAGAIWRGLHTDTAGNLLTTPAPSNGSASSATGTIAAPGSVGIHDYSYDASGASLTSPPGFTLRGTIPAVPTGSTRAQVEVQNQGPAVVLLLLDDGAAGTGTITPIVLQEAATSPEQGGAWSSTTFKGRVQVFCPTGSTTCRFGAHQN